VAEAQRVAAAAHAEVSVLRSQLAAAKQAAAAEAAGAEARMAAKEGEVGGRSIADNCMAAAAAAAWIIHCLQAHIHCRVAGFLHRPWLSSHC
jgi:hypothetical protein